METRQLDAKEVDTTVVRYKSRIMGPKECVMGTEPGATVRRYSERIQTLGPAQTRRRTTLGTNLLVPEQPG
jgi:hypothetical protein